MSQRITFPLVAFIALFLPLPSSAAPASFELTVGRRLSYGGEVAEAALQKDAGVEFAVIPKRALGVSTWFNPISNTIEQRIQPAVEHPIPVFRAAHIQAFKDKPDVTKLALDQVSKYGNQVEIQADRQFIVIGDGTGIVRLLSLTTVTIPQDTPPQWKVAGTMEPLKLADHVEDPVADRGRAVIANDPLPLTGRLVYGIRQRSNEPTQWHGVDLPDGKPKKMIQASEGRMAPNGTMVDRVDSRVLRVTDKSGKLLSEIKLDDDVDDYNIAADGKQIVFSTERYVDQPTPHRETATIVYSAEGKKLGEIVGYDDAAFLPDGRLVLTGRAADTGLFIGDIRTGKVEPITIKETPDGEQPFWPRNPVVSPDGKQIAYTSRRLVYVVDIDGRNWTPVWETPGDQPPQRWPAFSPDGKFIAVNIIPLTVMNGPGQIMVFDLAKHLRQPLPATQGADSETPLVWQAK